MKNKFDRLKLKDIVAILIFSLLGFVLNYLVGRSESQTSYIAFLFILVLLTSLLSYLVRKLATVTLFLLLLSLLTYNLNSLGTKGMIKVFLYIIIGLIFEFILLISNGQERNTVTNVLISSIISFSLLPLITGLLLSRESFSALFSATLNLTLLSVSVSIAGALVSYLIWHQFRTTKTFLRFEFGS